jgi:hypothetical protein
LQAALETIENIIDGREGTALTLEQKRRGRIFDPHGCFVNKRRCWQFPRWQISRMAATEQGVRFCRMTNVRAQPGTDEFEK